MTADHGESLGEHGIYYAHTGLYEPQLHVPLIVHAPGAPPLRSDALRELARHRADDRRARGRRAPHAARSRASASRASCAARRSRRSPCRASCVHQNAHNLAVAVREGDWKLIWPLAKDHPLLSGEPELYDLAHDPGETDDLAAREPERVAALRQHRRALDRTRADRAW